MEIKDVKCRWTWDMERLGDLAGHLKQRGKPICKFIAYDFSDE